MRRTATMSDDPAAGPGHNPAVLVMTPDAGACPARTISKPASDQGSAIAETVMTASFIVAVFLVVMQFAYAVHVRSTLTLAASEGARAGARVNAPSGTASQVTRDFVRNSVGARYAGNVTEGESAVASARVRTVSVTAPIPVLGPFGVGIELSTTARALIEERP